MGTQHLVKGRFPFIPILMVMDITLNFSMSQILISFMSQMLYQHWGTFVTYTKATPDSLASMPYVGTHADHHIGILHNYQGELPGTPVLCAQSLSTWYITLQC